MSKVQDQIVSTYQKKYPMTIQSYIKFIQQRVQISIQNIPQLITKIDQFQFSQNLSQVQLRFLIRLVSAYQNNSNTLQMSYYQIEKTTQRMVFRKKPKNREDGKHQEKEDKYEKKREDKMVNKESKENSWKNAVSQSQLQQIVYSDQEKETKPQSKPQSKPQQKPRQKPQPKPRQKSQQKSSQKPSQNSWQKPQLRPQKQQHVEKKIQKNNSISQQQIIYPNLQNDIKKSTKSVKQQPIKQNSYPYIKTQKTQDKRSTFSGPVLNSKPIQDSIDDQQPIVSSNKPAYLSLIPKQNPPIIISQYEKFSSDYINTIIKYKILYKDHVVLRRFSQFQKLLTLLSLKYQGFILPQLPPKQGLMKGLSYFWGVDNKFLQDRKNKLQDLLNRLYQIKGVSQEDVFKKFIQEDKYQIQVEEEGYGTYFRNVADIVFNAKELKDYGVAYCNYLREKGNVKLNPLIERKYQDIQEIITIFIQLNQYRKKLNLNFDQRRQLFSTQQKITCRAPSSTFDKSMQSLSSQIKNLSSQLSKYSKLKSQQSWTTQLIRIKGDTNQLLTQKHKLQGRIKKMEQNLVNSIDGFGKSKREELKDLGEQMVNWRKAVHP